MNRRATSRTAASARRGDPASDRREGLQRHALSTPRGIPDADFERLLAAWSGDPSGQDINVTISLRCSGLVLRISDREAIIAILRCEQERRRQLRRGSP